MHIKPQNLIFFLTACLAWLLLLPNANAQTIPSFNIQTEPLPIFAGDTAVVTILPNNFLAASTTFQWYVNDALNKSISGLGRNVITIKTAPQKQEIINIKVYVNPGLGFEETTRQTLIATIIPFRSTEQILKEAEKFKADFIIITTPPDPSPGQTVHFTLQAVGFDTDRTKIQWSVNDKTELSGMGEKAFDLQTGKLGETYRVRVSVTLPDGTVNSKVTTVRINDLSYYWWTDAVVPPWYKGKILPSVRSKVTILALPEITGVTANNLVYKWSFNDGPVLHKSGFAKQTYSFTPQFQGIKEEITVRAENISGIIKKEKTILISPVSPLIQFYQLKPLEGIDYSQSFNYFEAAAGSILDFAAELFFVPKNEVSDLSLGWRLNGKDVPSRDPTSPNILTVRSETGQIPEQNIQLNVEHKKTRNGGMISNSFRLRYK